MIRIVQIKTKNRYYLEDTFVKETTNGWKFRVRFLLHAGTNDQCDNRSAQSIFMIIVTLLNAFVLILLFFNQTNFTNSESVQSDTRKPPTVRVRPSCGACGVYGFTANTPWYIALTRTLWKQLTSRSSVQNQRNKPSSHRYIRRRTGLASNNRWITLEYCGLPVE